MSDTHKNANIDTLSADCAGESESFYQGQYKDGGGCFELFRRALTKRSNEAWRAVYDQFFQQVIRWVQRHPAFPQNLEEASFFANRAFEKMWTAVSPARFHRFPNLRAILGYLKTCVHAVIIDFARLAEHQRVTVDVEAVDPASFAVNPDIEGEIGRRQIAEELWQAIRIRLNDERERIVCEMTFLRGLRPREIHHQYDEIFADAKDVSQCKDNLLRRLRRDEDLARLLLAITEG